MLMDRMVRHGQIGGYGAQMEGVYDSTNRPAPIFEFCDLANVNGIGLAERLAQFNQQVVHLHEKATHPTLGMYRDKSKHSSSSDVEIDVLIKTYPDKQQAGQENNAKSGHQDQKLKATESAPPPAKQHKYELETEAEKPGQVITRPKDQSWWLLSFIHHYSGPSNWVPVNL